MIGHIEQIMIYICILLSYFLCPEKCNVKTYKNLFIASAFIYELIRLFSKLCQFLVKIVQENLRMLLEYENRLSSYSFWSHKNTLFSTLISDGSLIIFTHKHEKMVYNIINSIFIHINIVNTHSSTVVTINTCFTLFFHLNNL